MLLGPCRAGGGAVEIQIGRPVGEIPVTRGIGTFGASGQSLVKES